jgi:hypothetical protein
MEEKYVNKLNAGKSDAEGVIPTERAARLLEGIVFCDHDIRDIMSGMIDSSGTRRKVAKHLQVSEQYFGDVLAGKRPVSSNLAKKLGLKKVTVFVKGKGGLN